MKKWARITLILLLIFGAIGVAAAGTGYVWYKYDEYRLPEVISYDWDERVSAFVGIYQDKPGNIFFQALDTILKRRTDIEAYPEPILGGEGIIYLNEPAMRQEALSFTENWEAIKNNSRLKEGDPNWRADYQLAWEIFKNVPEEERYTVAYDLVKTMCIDHEKEHLDFYWGTINPWDISNNFQELLAISKSASVNLIELEHAEGLARSSKKKPHKKITANDVASVAVTALIMIELGNISKYEAYHMGDLESKVKSAAGKVYANAKMSEGLDY